MKNKFLTLLCFITVVAFTLTMTGCKKDPQPTPQGKEITLKVKAEGIHVQELKSFNPLQWIYNYNPNVYTLTMRGTQGNVYTYTATIKQLQAGVTVKVLANDTYTINYQSEHSGYISNYLDIIINETKTISTSADLILTAKNDDYLIVVDNQSISARVRNWSTVSGFDNMIPSIDGTFFYAYMNIINDPVTIEYRDGNGTFQKTFQPQISNIYHIVKPSVNGGTGINIIPFTYNEIIW